MSWVLIDDNVPNHPKFLKAGPDASWLWLCGVAYCRKHHTSGHIPRVALATLGVTTPQPAIHRLVKKLVEARLWDETESGWLVHDYERQYGDDVQAKAEREAKHLKKVTAGRQGGLAKVANRLAETPLLLEGELVARDTPVALALSVPFLSVPNTTKNISDQPKPHPIRDFLALHERLFIETTGNKPKKYNGREAKSVRELLERFSFNEASRLLVQFMASKDPFILNAGFGLNIFDSQINKLLSEKSTHQPSTGPSKSELRTQELLSLARRKA